jgi:cobalt/nickel transport system ATP-binding protein
MNPPASIRLQAVRFAYEPGHPVLRGVDLEVRAGERFGILGRSGAGKTTLLLHLNGLLCGEGRVAIGDVVVDRQTLPVARRAVGLVFQNPDDQFFTTTVEDDVAFGPLNLGLDRAVVRDRVHEVLGRLGLAGFERRNPYRLSLGERKRVALATVLAMEPSVVAFDEPFANLNPALVDDVAGLIERLPTTVVLVSQQIMPALVVCDRLAVLNDGVVVAVGPPAEIAGDRTLLSACGLDFWTGLEALDRKGLLRLDGFRSSRHGDRP